MTTIIFIFAVWSATNLVWTLANRSVDRLQRKRSEVQDGRSKNLDTCANALLPSVRTLN